MELKGSRTEKSLEAAFGGESQARNKYTYFAAVAKEEGFEQVAATFLETAENEKEHAKKEFDFLKGIGDTKANLKAAAEGEHYEWTEMYPEFERVSREEGFTEIANFFKEVAEVEEQHEKRYLTLLRNMEGGRSSRRIGWSGGNAAIVAMFTREQKLPRNAQPAASPGATTSYWLGTIREKGSNSLIRRA